MLNQASMSHPFKKNHPRIQKCKPLFRVCLRLTCLSLSQPLSLSPPPTHTHTHTLSLSLLSFSSLAPSLFLSRPLSHILSLLSSPSLWSAYLESTFQSLHTLQSTTATTSSTAGSRFSAVCLTVQTVACCQSCTLHMKHGVNSPLRKTTSCSCIRGCQPAAMLTRTRYVPVCACLFVPACAHAPSLTRECTHTHTIFCSQPLSTSLNLSQPLSISLNPLPLSTSRSRPFPLSLDPPPKRNKTPGWWEKFIGPGKAIDTNKYFVICSNNLGGCYGSSGPSSINPLTNEVYATSFPLVTVEDMVRAQFLLLDHLGIEQVHASVGSSLGGMQALAAAAMHPDRVKLCVSVSAAHRAHPTAIALRYARRANVAALTMLLLG